MRKILVKYLVLYYHMSIFGKRVTVLRAPNVLFPMTVLVALIVTGNPDNWDLYWYDYVALGVLALTYWLGLGNFKWTYFGIWPAKFDEMDEFQALDYYDAIIRNIVPNPETGKFSPLSKQQQIDFENLSVFYKHFFGDRFENLHILIPPIISILAILVWFYFTF